ncbi:hypothetical protein [Fusobacterium sp. IOR10]|uniref:hypothetical protein n=1 Tax=Fusobacterium sp. IOR10 TaxID=2665157 RepID=UPI0013CF7C6F|nr:hypothetical protein [Fusobacterium sp. IOR10]
MEIWLSTNNSRDILRIPYIPPDINISDGLDKISFENIKGQVLDITGNSSKRKVTINSFFPSKYYSFLPGNVFLSPLCLEFFKRNRYKVLRIVITGLTVVQINMECKIDTFKFFSKRNKDVGYSLVMTEYFNPKKMR